MTETDANGNAIGDAEGVIVQFTETLTSSNGVLSDQGIVDDSAGQSSGSNAPSTSGGNNGASGGDDGGGATPNAGGNQSSPPAGQQNGTPANAAPPAPLTPAEIAAINQQLATRQSMLAQFEQKYKTATTPEAEAAAMRDIKGQNQRIKELRQQLAVSANAATAAKAATAAAAGPLAPDSPIGDGNLNVGFVYYDKFGRPWVKEMIPDPQHPNQSTWYFRPLSEVQANLNKNWSLSEWNAFFAGGDRGSPNVDRVSYEYNGGELESTWDAFWTTFENHPNVVTLGYSTQASLGFLEASAGVALMGTAGFLEFGTLGLGTPILVPAFALGAVMTAHGVDMSADRKRCQEPFMDNLR